METKSDYYDRLVMGNEKFYARQRQIEGDVKRQRKDQERVNNKTWGMGVNE